MHQQRLGIRRFDILQNGAQSLLRLLRREAAQSVIAAQFDQHPARLMLFKQRRQTRQPLLRRVAADAGVNYRRFCLPLIVK